MLPCTILGFHRGVNEICALLGFYAADVSGQPIGLIFKGQAVQDGIDRLSRNVCKKIPIWAA